MALIETGTIEGTQITFDMGFNFAGDGFSCKRRSGLEDLASLMSLARASSTSFMGENSTVTLGDLTCGGGAPVLLLQTAITRRAPEAFQR